jgi:hypothetical protein
MTTMRVQEALLFVEVVGHGYPLVLMHGGPGLDRVSLTPWRELAEGGRRDCCRIHARRITLDAIHA